MKYFIETFRQEGAAKLFILKINHAKNYSRMKSCILLEK